MEVSLKVEEVSMGQPMLVAGEAVHVKPFHYEGEVSVSIIKQEAASGVAHADSRMQINERFSQQS